ncbi:cytochrome c heme lyase [Schizosaccharomyces cryophilus OY26]|uniref:Holocytochrome c-type synthase n=1 Tax=Schizosaccharomyces cryophilus (strain OY26 / ATCC MYA-4695 / CBS 11777 / NBRC 106824 / NRRL Y48691) TaxID=653667 RepID=S9W107_SCHCR|nr:cytochrome c heme lyase [Schizosaccharomyces cryophilus OY26]EPY53578.1 cytochrome c heme lyase [Schizosaccharomyces cryophilus OY26]
MSDQESPNARSCPIDHRAYTQQQQQEMPRDTDNWSSWLKTLWTTSAPVGPTSQSTIGQSRTNELNSQQIPPECPMHAQREEADKKRGPLSWFGWRQDVRENKGTIAVAPEMETIPSECPMSKQKNNSEESSSWFSFLKPVEVREQPKHEQQQRQTYPSECPMSQGTSSKESWSSWLWGKQEGGSSEMNPDNLMYKDISQKATRDQVVNLGTNRSTSSIPKADGDLWKYPSPQQMYNAMWRKGYRDSGENVPMMVEIHNFLNEGAWKEIQAWEQSSGQNTDPKLLRFEGNASKKSPRAMWYMMLGRMFPGRWGTSEGPFDRHDWYVQRKDNQIVRYIIDYYEAPDDGGQPVFSLDVRPALDDLNAMRMRWRHWQDQRESNH